jgi:complement component 1 Q subcomponent-binding protein, mitochondrial
MMMKGSSNRSARILAASISYAVLQISLVSAFTLRGIPPYSISRTNHGIVLSKFASVRQSSTLTASTTRADALADLLKRAHAEELENGNDSMPDELKKLQANLAKEWKIVDSPENAVVRMYKTLDSSAKVQVWFHCQDTIDSGVDEEDDEAEAVEEEEPSSAVKVTVTITKAGQTAVFGCLSEDAAIYINSCAVSLTEDVETLISEGGSVSVEQYQGPEVSEMAEDVQNSLHEYLEDDVGLSTDFATFVSMYTDYKEQNQYIQFLDNLTNIVKK